VIATALLLAGLGAECLATDSTPPPPPLAQAGLTNSQALLTSYLQLQEELRATQQTIEQNRQEARTAATQTADALSKGLEGIQQAFAAQRTQDLEALQRFNKLVLTVAGALAALGFLTMVVLSWLQWRMSQRLAGITAALPAALGLEAGSAIHALGPGVELSQARLPVKASYSARPLAALSKPHRPPGLSLERRLFPKATDAFRRRQFRALKTAVFVGLLFAGLVALVLCLVYSHRGA
jgi:hypothetical protein